MTIVYPHRVTFLERGNCDVCGNPGQELVHANTDNYFGWESCNDEECNNTIQNWYNNTRKSIKDLKSQLGEWIYVKRTSGKLESGWEISSDAYQEIENGPYWVKVRHVRRHLTKIVQLDDIEKWNQI